MLSPAERSVLEVLQHPLRLAVHETLRSAGGPMSEESLCFAVQNNERLVRSALNKLSRVGLAHGYGSGAGVWVATAMPVRVPDLAAMDPDDPDRLLVATVWRMFNERRAAHVLQWARVGTEPQWATWADHSIGQDGVVLASPGQLAALELDMLDMFKEYGTRRKNDPDAVPVWLSVVAAPAAALRR